jgi:hypothetical protein
MRVLVVLMALATACSSDGAVDSSGHVNELLSAGVLRVHWTHTGEAADLNLRRLEEMDAVPIPEPQCARDVGGEHPVYIDLNWRAVKDDVVVPEARISIASADETFVTVVEPDGQCRLVQDYDLEKLPAKMQRVMQLVTSGGAGGPAQLTVVVNRHRLVLPLIPACGPSGQSSSLSCTIDPVGYVSGAPFSSDLQL